LELNSIYSEIIMEHNKSGHNRRHLAHADHVEKGHNPSCGDEIYLEIKYAGNVIEDLSFTGEGCAISQASTSMMIDLLKGKNKQEALKLIELFLAMIKREESDEEKLEVLEDAFILKNISNMPARVKCAVLAWHTLKETLNKN
jgi:nitrogen fixation NifU-like protein